MEVIGLNVNGIPLTVRSPRISANEARLATSSSVMPSLWIFTSRMLAGRPSAEPKNVRQPVVNCGECPSPSLTKEAYYPLLEKQRQFAGATLVYHHVPSTQ